MGVSVAERQKEERLKEYIKNLGSLAVAFSGGVDSTNIAHIAHDVRGDKIFSVKAV